jgi:molybdate transport system substrate-binding protein
MPSLRASATTPPRYLPGTRKNLAKNSVVLIVPASTSQISGFSDLVKPAVKSIAIGEPQTVPAGRYAQEVLRYLKLYDQLKPKLVLAKDVRQVLTHVETGNADAGIVYATDAKISKKVSVIATAPEDSHSPVLYPRRSPRSFTGRGVGRRNKEGGSVIRSPFPTYHVG